MRLPLPNIALPAIMSKTCEQKRGTILLADDEAAVLTVTAHVLRRMGFDVLTAEDGRQAVDIFRQCSPAISWGRLDLTMPFLKGKDAFQEIRHIRPDARVVLTSGHDAVDCNGSTLPEGLSGFIQKPFRPQELREKLESILKP